MRIIEKQEQILDENHTESCKVLTINIK